MTDTELAAMLERCEKATEGPWEVHLNPGEDTCHIYATHGWMFVTELRRGADADFIAHARTDLPLVVKELIEARRLLREWTDMDPLRYDSEYSACPWCAFDYSNMRHEPDCPFVLARTMVGIAAGGERC